MVRHVLRGMVGLCVVLASIGAVSMDVLAVPGPWLGIGVANQSAGGDLDGTHAYANFPLFPTEFLVAGKIQDGNGIAADFGYGINPYLAVEFMYVYTNHTATTPLLVPTLDSSANISELLLGLRGTYPVMNGNAELFVRGMLGSYGVTYAKYDVMGAIQANGTIAYTSTNQVTFSGLGYGIGAGIEALFGKVGVSAGYTLHQATLTTATTGGGGFPSALSSSLNAPVTTFDLLVTYHWGPPVKEEEKKEEK